MTHKELTIEEAVKYIENHDDPFVDFGFRADSYTPVKKFRKSSYHGDDFPEFQLSGVSVVSVPARMEKYIKDAYEWCEREYNDFDNKKIFLLEGEMGNADEVTHDPKEGLMTSHKIVATIIK